MVKFAANLSMMFTEVDFLDRFEAAAKAGFKGVEFLFPYEWPADEIAARLKANGLTQALFNLPPGDWTKGERGLAAMPGREKEFEAAMRQALEYAEAGQTSLVLLLFSFLILAVVYAVNRKVWAVWPKNC